MVEAGGLASVVVDQHDLGWLLVKMIAKVLKGENQLIRQLMSFQLVSQ